MDFKEIFKKGILEQQAAIIKTVPIDSEINHKTGIVNLIKHFEPEFNFTADNMKVLNMLFQYFTGNVEKCKELDLSLNKGIMLIGNQGSGKSFLMKIFKIYTGQILCRNSFQHFEAQSIIAECNISGTEFLERFNNSVNNPIVCYIDDIANTNEKVKHFGTEINAIETLLDIRYLVLQKNKKLTHVSTNIYPIDMVNKKIYDIRIIDRMKEMFNIIELKSEKSFRK